MDTEKATEIIRKLWIKQVHIDEAGEFSDCPPECDDCFWVDYFDVHSVPLLEFIKPLCETFEVTAPRTGKVYTYYRPTQAAIDFLLKHAMKEIEEAGARLEDLQKRDRERRKTRG